MAFYINFLGTTAMKMTPQERKAHVNRLDAIFEKHVVRKPFSWSDVPEGRRLVVVNWDRGCYLIIDAFEHAQGLKDQQLLKVTLVDGEVLHLKADVWTAAVRP